MLRNYLTREHGRLTHIVKKRQDNEGDSIDPRRKKRASVSHPGTETKPKIRDCGTVDLLQSIISDLLLAEEKERQRIALNLHDNLGQTLMLAKIKLDGIIDGAAGTDPRKGMEEVRTLINQSIQQARSFMTDICPAILHSPLGFSEKIEWLCNDMQNRCGLTITFTSDDRISEIDNETQLLLFRAVKELLMNIAKHAYTEAAFVTLQQAGKNIKITVKDEGKGFDTTPSSELLKRSKGFGLLSIQERLGYLDGCFELESCPGRGTCATLTVASNNGEPEHTRGTRYDYKDSSGR